MKGDDDMKKRIIAILIAVLTVIGVMSTVSFADTGVSEIYSLFAENKVSESTYTDSFGMKVDITTYSDSNYASNGAVILYVINHMGEYPGTDSDEDIISDLLADGYIVSVLDYHDNPLSVSPNIESSVQTIRLEMMKKGTYLGGLTFDSSKTYVLPAGYRIARDIVYFELAKHGSQSSLDYTVEIWNTQESVAKAVYNQLGETYATKTDNGDGTYKYALTAKAKVDNVYDIIMKDGTYMTDEDMELRLDIIYPSSPTNEVPVAVLASSGTPRNSSTASTSHADRIQFTGFLFRGYAAICYDHEYIPFMNSDVGGWGHFEPAYTLQSRDGVKMHTAAIRCIKYYADEYGYSSEKIGVFGHSKSSWASLLSNPESENLPENNQGDFPPISGTPFLTDKNGNALNADIACCYHSMGNGSARYANYLTTQNIPTIICNGQKDSGNGNSYWEKEKAAYIKSGIEFLAIPMENNGHTYPIGDDTVYDYNRYVAFCKFFDYYLKDTAPEILYSSVKNGRLNDLKTTTVKYSAGTAADRWQIIEGDKLFVQFVAPVTEWSFIEAVKVEDSSGNEVKGSWYAQGNGNKWIFDGKLSEGATYTLTVADGKVSDKYGRVVEEGITVEFTK